VIAKFEFSIDPIKQADKLKAGLRNKVLRIALNKAASRVKAAVISKAPQRTGSLKKAIRIKVKNYKARNLWVAIVGASSKYKRNVKKKQIRPVYYAKLVETGTRHSPAQPYLKPALHATKQQYLETLRQSIEDQVKQILSQSA
jgi:HK97 gp10 family phage protein